MGTESESNLWNEWREAARRPEVDAALQELYGALDGAIAERGPTCWASGKCCKFDEFGHRLYVTGLEVAWFLNQVERGEVDMTAAENGAGMAGQAVKVRLPQLAEHPGACPYQVAGRCTTHKIRPLGCRIFFCQKGTESWQQDLYESFLKRLQGLHDAHGLAYRYLDWMAGLEAAGGDCRG
ncbi:MAG: hypothetical protein V3V20_09080 [Algisphaera sp.]